MYFLEMFKKKNIQHRILEGTTSSLFLLDVEDMDYASFSYKLYQHVYLLFAKIGKLLCKI